MSGMNNERHRRGRTFCAALALIGPVSALTFGTLASGSHDDGVIFLGIVLPWSIVARFPGAWIGSRVGLLTRHTVGWFTGFAGAGASILLLNFASSPGSFVRDYGDGLGAAAWIYGMVAATFAVILTAAVDVFWT
jgi:hypothetical protein